MLVQLIQQPIMQTLNPLLVGGDKLAPFSADLMQTTLQLLPLRISIGRVSRRSLFHLHQLRVDVALHAHQGTQLLREQELCVFDVFESEPNLSSE